MRRDTRVRSPTSTASSAGRASNSGWTARRPSWRSRRRSPGGLTHATFDIAVALLVAVSLALDVADRRRLDVLDCALTAAGEILFVGVLLQDEAFALGRLLTSADAAG